MQDVSNLTSADWESPARDAICDSLSDILIDNYNSALDSISNINNYVNVAITNYEELESYNKHIFDSFM